MLFTLRSSFYALILSALVLSTALPQAFAQSQASCTFKLFMLNPSGKNLSPKGINNYNTIVGWYLDAGEGSHGFKRYSNGSFVNLNYPGSQYTLATGINDSGTIAGWFADSAGAHGFIYSSGKWAPLNFGTTNTTQVFGISNANK